MTFYNGYYNMSPNVYKSHVFYYTISMTREVNGNSTHEMQPVEEETFGLLPSLPILLQAMASSPS